MGKPLMRIPYTELLSPPRIVPRAATTLTGALEALSRFFASPPPDGLPASTVVLTGAGLSVSSGLADYRGVNGTYRVNKSYRPIYYHEFVNSHEARKRYWARSFLGWSTLHNASPNAGHYALRDLGRLGIAGKVVTQNVDSFHPQAHPDIPTLELHGYLRSTVCITCRTEYPRDDFQTELTRLNPLWAAFLAEALASGALNTEDPSVKRARGLRANPDGDVDLPDAPYTTFRYPACPHCLASPPATPDNQRQKVDIDTDGAWQASSTAGILKPSVVMFGESIADSVKTAAEEAIDGAGRLFVLGTSLATYSAWRLVKRARDRNMPIAIVNMGGVRGDELFYAGLDPDQDGRQGVRVEQSTDVLLPRLVEELQRLSVSESSGRAAALPAERSNFEGFKDMLS